MANLVRYEPSGIYFARAKVRGKLVRKSLDTNVLSELRRLRPETTVAAGFDHRGDGHSARTYGRDTRQRRL